MILRLQGRRKKFQSAFTLVELIIAITIMGAILSLAVIKTGTFTYWNEESFIKRLSETIIFLHHQAQADQAFYRMEFNFKKNSYSIGVLRPADDVDDSFKDLSADAGALSLELAAFLNPSVGKDYTLIPPPSYPSLAEPVSFPAGTYIQDMNTMRGKIVPEKSEKGFIFFSPRGFSEFAVIHLRLQNGAPVTILVNPFTGLTDIFHDYKEFQWTYGKKQQKS